MGASGQSTGPYQINQSIRFDQSENAYLKRTPSDAGNRRTWTWSGWLKHSDQSTNGYHNIWSVRSGANDYFEMTFLNLGGAVGNASRGYFSVTKLH